MPPGTTVSDGDGSGLVRSIVCEAEASEDAWGAFSINALDATLLVLPVVIGEAVSFPSPMHCVG